MIFFPISTQRCRDCGINHIHPISFSPTVSNYSNILGMNEQGYGAMPTVEHMLASYLFPTSASSLKDPRFPTKQVRTTLALVGKLYVVPGQGSVCLHTLQACQADLLKGLSDKGGGRIASGHGSLSSCYQENSQSHQPFNGSTGSHGETSVVESV